VVSSEAERSGIEFAAAMRACAGIGVASGFRAIDAR
jgi:hypothetical protein